MNQNNRQYQILVVEDEKAIARLIEKKLARHNFTVHFVNSGTAALDFLKHHRDEKLLLLLDYKLGDMTGTELLNKLTDLDIHVPFIVTTGYGSEQIAVEMMRLGAKDYLVKDSAFITLLESVVEKTVTEMTLEDQLAQAQDSLRQEQLLLRTLIDSLPEMIYIKDPQIRYILANSTAAHFMGAERPEQVIGKTDFDFFPEKTAVKFRHDDQQVAKSHKPLINYQESVPDSEGNLHYLLTTKVPILDQNGNTSRIIGTGSDITDIRQTEENLRKEKTHLLENIPDFVFQLDEENNFTAANPAARKILGYSEKELLGKNIKQIMYPADFEKLRLQIENLKQNKKTTPKPLRFTAKDNSVKWLEGNLVAVYNDHPRPVAVSAIFKDITEQKISHDELIEAEQRVRLLLENSPNIIFEAGLNCKIISANRAGRRFFAKLRKPELKGEDCIQLFPKKWQPFVSKAFKVALKGKSVKITVQAADLNGQLKWLDVVFSPITDPGNNVTRIIGTCWDVSERVKKEQKVLDLQKKMDSSLEHADRLLKVGHVAAQIAHEIGNPLAFVSSRMQRIISHSEPVDPEQIKTIYAHIQRMSELIGRLSDLGRKKTLRLIETDINPVIESAIDLVAGSKQFRNITIHRKIAKNLPPIKMDPDKISQILLNLLLNAADACHDGGDVTISARKKTIPLETQDRKTNTDFLVLSVKDNGTGIPPHLIDSIFEPFFTTKSPGQGTGLGLAVSLSIIHQHSGWIDVESKPHNTTFTLHLPYEPKKVAPAAANIQTIEQVAASTVEYTETYGEEKTPYNDC